jgi:CRISPR system Cascade subunit CasC
VCLRHAAPMNLANAFEKPVAPRRDASLSAQSVEALASYEAKLGAVYGDPKDQWLTLDLSGQWPQAHGQAQGNLKGLADAVQALAAQALPVAEPAKG